MIIHHDDDTKSTKMFVADTPEELEGMINAYCSDHHVKAVRYGTFQTWNGVPRFSALVENSARLSESPHPDAFNPFVQHD